MEAYRMTPSLSRPLSREEAAAFGAELDELRNRILAALGENDARYVRRIRDAVRWTELGGRALLLAGILPPAWILGTLLLGCSKILENMELGHNVMHGQYDWRSEEHTSELQSHSDLVCRLLLEKKKNEINKIKVIKFNWTNLNQ